MARLDLLAEARVARTLADLSWDQTLALVTLEGARALGLAGEIGSLAPGKWGDLAVIRLRGDRPPGEQVMNSATEAVVATYIGGRQVFGRTGA